jgi:hypothetical protein
MRRGSSLEVKNFIVISAAQGTDTAGIISDDLAGVAPGIVI